MIKEKNPDFDFLEEFENFIKASQKGKRTKQNGSKILEGSVRKLKATYNILKDFSEKKEFPLKPRIIKQTNRREVESQKKYWNKFYQRFSDYLHYDLDCYDNYADQLSKT